MTIKIPPFKRNGSLTNLVLSSEDNSTRVEIDYGPSHDAYFFFGRVIVADEENSIDFVFDVKDLSLEGLKSAYKLFRKNLKSSINQLNKYRPIEPRHQEA